MKKKISYQVFHGVYVSVTCTIGGLCAKPPQFIVERLQRTTFSLRPQVPPSGKLHGEL